jgi:thiol-disulfide isomerase/thioredoxin
MKIIAALIACCMAISGLGQKGTVALKATLSKQEKIILYFSDKSLENIPPLGLSAKYPSKTMSLGEPVMLYHADSMHIPLLVFPGDRINLRKQGAVTIAVSADKNNMRTNELNFLSGLVLSQGSLEGMYAVDGIPVVNPLFAKMDSLHFVQTGRHLKKAPATNEERDSLLYAIYRLRINYLNDYRKTKPLSERFYNYMQHWLLYKYIAVSCWGSVFSGLPSGELPQYLKRTLLQQGNNLFNDSLIVMDSYRLFLLHYNRYLCINQYQKPDDPISRMETAAAYFTGTTKDFILYAIAKAAFQNVAITDKQAIADLFFRTCSDSNYISIIRKNRALADIASNNKNETKVLSKKGDPLTIAAIINRHRGKLIYIDCWASWCMPCLEEMPNATRLQQQYKGKDIVFLYLSMDKSPSAWERGMKDLPALMNDASSYLLLNNFESVFARQYNIQSIPRYILVGKDGNIISADAPRPGDPALKNILDQRL